MKEPRAGGGDDAGPTALSFVDTVSATERGPKSHCRSRLAIDKYVEVLSPNDAKSALGRLVWAAMEVLDPAFACGDGDFRLSHDRC